MSEQEIRPRGFSQENDNGQEKQDLNLTPEQMTARMEAYDEILTDLVDLLRVNLLPLIEASGADTRIARQKLTEIIVAVDNLTLTMPIPKDEKEKFLM